MARLMQLTISLNAKEQEMYTVQDEIAILKKQIKTAEGEKNTVKKDIQKLESQLIELNMKKLVLQKFIQDTIAAIEEANTKREDYEAYLKILEHQMNDLQNKISVIESTIKDLKERIEKATIDREELLKEMNLLQAEMKGLQSLISDIQNSINDLERQLSRTKNRNARRDIRIRIDNLKRDLRLKRSSRVQIKEKINGIITLATEKKMYIGMQIVECNNENNYKVGKQENLSHKKTQEGENNRKRLREESKEKSLQTILSQNQTKLNENISNGKQITIQIDTNNEKIKEIQQKIKQIVEERGQKEGVQRKIKYQMKSLQNQLNAQKIILNEERFKNNTK